MLPGRCLSKLILLLGQALVEPLAFAKLSLRDLSAVPEEWMLKLLRLFQLCMEYMLNVKVRIQAARGKRRPIPTS